MQIAGHGISPTGPLLLIAGPCVIESEGHALKTAAQIADIAAKLGIFTIYKSSFDKANRTSAQSARGPGIDEGLRILARVRDETGLPVLTDVHECWQVKPTAEAVDVLQIPAFLSRQTDLIVAAAASGKSVNIKKGQFMSPGEACKAAEKAQSAATGDAAITLCERGSSFGYQNLVVDMRGLALMRQAGAPIIFDASHAVQLPGGMGTQSGGNREHIPILARAAVAAGVAGVFIETHPDPAKAQSDSATVWPLDQLEALVADLIHIDVLVKERGMLAKDQFGDSALRRKESAAKT